MGNININSLKNRSYSEQPMLINFIGKNDIYSSKDDVIYDILPLNDMYNCKDLSLSRVKDPSYTSGLINATKPPNIRKIKSNHVTHKSNIVLIAGVINRR